MSTCEPLPSCPVCRKTNKEQAVIDAAKALRHADWDEEGPDMAAWRVFQNAVDALEGGAE